MKKNFALLAALLAFLVSGSFASAFSSDGGLQWLYSQNQNGSFGFPGGNAFALMALRDWNANASLQSQIAGNLIADLNDNTSWTWGEADIPSAELWALVKTGLTQGLNVGGSTQRLLALKGSNGGFKGLEECVSNCSNPDWTKQVWKPVESTTDTALALIALQNAGSLDAQTKNGAISFLYSMQNADGSFNQTRDFAETRLYSLGPDLTSTTALALMALEQNGAGQGAQAQNALSFLEQKARGCFSDSASVYGPSLASIALAKTGVSGDFSSAVAQYEVMQQHQDGGFADPLRSSTASDAMDTGVALSASKNIAGSVVCAPLNASVSFNSMIFSGSDEPLSVSASGLVKSAKFLVTSPNGGLSEIPAVQAQTQNQTRVFQGDFPQTSTLGNYSVVAVVTPKYGPDEEASGVFQSMSLSQLEATPTPTPTPTATPTPTPTPAPQSITLVIATPVPLPTQAPARATPTPVPSVQSAPAAQNQNQQPSAQAQQLQQNSGENPASQVSPVTAFAVAATPTPWFEFSVGEKAIALSVNPIAFISLAALGVIFSLYKRWKA